jgi:hypothetical protein
MLKVMRIWSINEGKLYTLAYVAESSQYDRYLPSFQRMVDSFSIDNTTTQVESGDRSREDNSGNGNCDPSYLPVCIKPPPPDLNCGDISYKNFKVTGSDPHGFDRDNDGIGCESANGGAPTPPLPPCDPSYLPVCIKPPPPDLNCGAISYKNFKVTGTDPHGFDRDNDGIGCDSASGGDEPDQCTEDGLSAGSYFDPRNGFIVGSPCDPVEYCSDEGSKDPVVIDYCQDIWTDTDECLLNPKLCEDVPPPECPEGQVGTPPDCEVPPPECPEGQVGTPPDCEPVINGNGEEPPPENGEEPPPENGEEPPPENGEEPPPENGEEPPDNGDIS